MTLLELVQQAHSTAIQKGWYDGDGVGDINRFQRVANALLMIHDETSEAVREIRGQGVYTDIEYAGSKPEGFVIELADIVIRVADLCGYLGIDLEEAVEAKMQYNKSRGHRHGGKRL